MKDKNFSRRAFLKKNAMTSLGVISLGSGLGTLSCKNARVQSTKPASITSIGGVTLEQIRDKYRYELFNNFIPNMDRYAIDHELGGVMCSLDVRTGELANMNKTPWFVGRGMWVYSYLYSNLEQNPRYLEIASKSKDLLLKIQPTDGNFYTQTFNREGVALTGPGDIYGSLFVAEGLALYSKASGEKKYRDIAKKIIFDCLARYDQPDYTYSVGVGGNRQTPEIHGTRVLGHWMIFLSLSTQMLKIEPDEDLEKLAARCVDAILNHHVNSDYGLTNEILHHDFSLPNNEFSQFSNVGHGLETLAFVMFEAARRNDTELFKKAAPIFKKLVDVATDPVYGGYFTTLQHVDNYMFSTGKSLWCQQEVLNGTMFLIEHIGDEWALNQFARADAFAFEKYFKPEHKFFHSGGDRKMINPNVNLMEHYHHARWVMYTIQSIERMIERGGEVSGIFS